LAYRGYSIEDLVKYASFEEVAMLLSKKRAPDRKKWLEEKGNLANV
jgi:citrate synthase